MPHGHGRRAEGHGHGDAQQATPHEGAALADVVRRGGESVASHRRVPSLQVKIIPYSPKWVSSLLRDCTPWGAGAMWAETLCPVSVHA